MTKRKIFFKKILWSTLLYIIIFCGLFFFTTTSAVKIEIPEGKRESDIIVTPQETQISSGETDIFELIQIINRYLRFSIGLVCMIWLVVGGFKLMSAQGEEEANKKASNILTWSLIWILISILSYALIRIVVNLF
jgi:hypothetical protein